MVTAGMIPSILTSIIVTWYMLYVVRNHMVRKHVTLSHRTIKWSITYAWNFSVLFYSNSSFPISSKNFQSEQQRIKFWGQTLENTRMHSSREGVSQHALDRGVCFPACTGQGVSTQGVSAQGVSAHWGCLPQWVCLPRRCLPRGCLPRGVCPGVSAQGGVCLLGVSARHPPQPCEQNDWQTPVKILSWRNFVADGKNLIYLLAVKHFLLNEYIYIIGSIKI